MESAKDDTAENLARSRYLRLFDVARVLVNTGEAHTARSGGDGVGGNTTGRTARAFSARCDATDGRANVTEIRLPAKTVLFQLRQESCPSLPRMQKCHRSRRLNCDRDKHTRFLVDDTHFWTYIYLRIEVKRSRKQQNRNAENTNT